MRAGLAIIAAAALIGPAATASAQDKPDGDPRCESSITQEMVECAAAKTAQWDKRLNAAYRKVLKAAQAEQREQLRKAQRLWIQYRDANCLYWALGEGTISRVLSAGCMYRMTKERTQELEDAAVEN